MAYLPEGVLCTHQSDQIVKKCGPLRRGLEVRFVRASWFVPERHLGVSAEEAANCLRLLEKVAIIIAVDLLYS